MSLQKRSSAALAVAVLLGVAAVPGAVAGLGVFDLGSAENDPLGAAMTQAVGELVAASTAPVDGTVFKARVELRQPRKQAELRQVAPTELRSFRLLGHAHAPVKVLMLCEGSTLDEVQAMLDLVREINETANAPPAERLKLHLIAAGPNALVGLRTDEAGFGAHAEVNPYLVAGDRWLQDWGEIAMARVDGDPHERLLVLDTDRRRGLQMVPAALARTWSGRYLKPAGLRPGDQHTGNYGGNIEVTPDGLLYLGSTSDEALRDFFAAAGYEGKMVVLDTSWLTVGHVDEFVTCVPTPDTEVGYTLVKADPRLALDLLASIPKERLLGSLRDLIPAYYRCHRIRQPLLLGDEHAGPVLDEEELVREMARRLAALHGALTEAASTSDVVALDLRRLNEDLAGKIDAQVEKLVAAIAQHRGDGARVDVVSLPVLFKNHAGAALALLPDVVNMLVLGNHLAIPDPLLPEFRARVLATLQGLGLAPHLLPVGTYHFAHGQLHCGTNVLRHPGRFVHPRYEREARFRSLHAERAP